MKLTPRVLTLVVYAAGSRQANPILTGTLDDHFADVHPSTIGRTDLMAMVDRVTKT